MSCLFFSYPVSQDTALSTYVLSILQNLGLSRTSSLLPFSYIRSSVNIPTKALYLFQINVQYNIEEMDMLLLNLIQYS